MKDRGDRRSRTKSIIKRRLKTGEHVLFGLGDQKRAEPHRMAKVKNKFTAKGGSMKEEKQAANRASRGRAKRAVKAEKDIPPESKNSVRWSYW